MNVWMERDPFDDPLVPEHYRAELIAELPKYSTVMSLARKVPMTSDKAVQPVLSTVPDAYWVVGDYGLKGYTKVDWRPLDLVAEEIAAVVPIPDAYIDDAALPLWGVMRPLLAEAIGKAIDDAILFGRNKPVTWEAPAVITGAIDAGNVVPAGTGVDIGQDIASMGQLLGSRGYGIGSFTATPGMEWNLIGQRGKDGRAIYGGSIAKAQPATLYGRPMAEVANGSWQPAQALLVGGDWSKVVIGVRQDMTFEMFDQGVVSDGTGRVVLNLMQQDSQALRVTMKLGYSLAVSATQLDPDHGAWPFAALTPA